MAQTRFVWTKEKLDKISDIDFALWVLNEKGAKYSSYSPIGRKIQQTKDTLYELR